ncbi:solute carrier family 25 member 38 [Arthroderma uncinatum]|uniref:solute carrier family 25 member 38 n=1 Tax=Arthroderma uncinatum TaxID=74035 RepID=UPI00144AB2C9|nr:solute carrier family 25 member 38 [Arthroderma uncinatum]KAF3482792.1 solute carrier family 25 member 38 [Arthroderma uncinatum]
MSLVSRMSDFFATSDSSTLAAASSSSSGGSTLGDGGMGLGGLKADSILRREERIHTQHEEKDVRPPYLHCMIAGGIGGTSGDMLMHSLDTVKTRQQGDPHIPPKYSSMSSSYATIFRQEGIRRGLYGGVTPALCGSFPGTVIFFGTYEYRFIADFAASFVYVPSEVLKTRLQLQGRYNNPFFKSGYNYRSTADAFRTIVRQEGFFALYSGFKATLFRDMPFSALQFAFYEQEQQLAKRWVGQRDIGFSLEVLTAATAGGMAGVITCPLDVVKTRIQTQQNPDALPSARPAISSTAGDAHKSARLQAAATATASTSTSTSTTPPSSQTRFISTSSPSTSTVKPGAAILHTSSILTGLKLIYKTEGVAGWFRGVGPRFLWTSIQSGTMLVLYQYFLKQLESYQELSELRSALI